MKAPSARKLPAHSLWRVAVWVGLAGLLTGGNPPDVLLPGSISGAVQSAYASESGCGNLVATGDSSHIMTVGGNTVHGNVERQYALRVPSTYDANTPTPLVVLHHFMSGAWPIPGIHNSMTMNWPGPIEPIIVRPRALALSPTHPEGTPRAWNLNLEWADVEFIMALKHHLRATYCIDDQRVFHHGESSGSFGAQGTGCHTQASAIVGDRGGILHPPHAVTHWTPGFPLTPVPPDAACGPTPVLLGFANQDGTIPFNDYAVPTIDFWVVNNACEDSPQYDGDATTAVCNNPTIQNCACQRYSNCSADLVVCRWDGGHGASEIGQPEAAWWFAQVDQHDSNPTLYHETFPTGVPTHAWTRAVDPGFALRYLPEGRVYMRIPKSQGYAYNGRAEAQLTVDAWDMPTPHDFAVGVTVTNVLGKFSEARLRVAQGGQSVEIRTYAPPLTPGGNVMAQVYVNNVPQGGSSWVITRQGEKSQLIGGACWLLRADPITDMITVSQRGMDTWPDCAGSWNDVVTFASPFLSLNMHDQASYPLNVSLSAWRNTAATASSDGYIQFDDVYFSRASLGPGPLP
jgi:poly(3-hydroxybutyrate) depolymerase